MDAIAGAVKQCLQSRDPESWNPSHFCQSWISWL